MRWSFGLVAEKFTIFFHLVCCGVECVWHLPYIISSMCEKREKKINKTKNAGNEKF